VTATASYRTSSRTPRLLAPAHRAGPHHRPRYPGRRRHNRFWRLVAGLLVLSILVGAGWLVGFSQVLAARNVAVIGLHRVDPALIREAAAVPLGLPLARQDLPAIASRVSSLPKIESAKVSRQWPDTVRITVVERRPLLGVRQPAGFVLVDAQGVAFETSAALPTGVLQADVNPDNGPLLVEVGAIAAAMPSKLQRRVERLHATSRNNITVFLTNGIAVNWGTEADSVLKSQLVLALLKRRPSVIDVSSPHNPAIR
jgi:cell division protein FtsQ